jgi:hypothetical protein
MSYTFMPRDIPYKHPAGINVELNIKAVLITTSQIIVAGIHDVTFFEIGFSVSSD